MRVLEVTIIYVWSNDKGYIMNASRINKKVVYVAHLWDIAYVFLLHFCI